MIYTKKKIKQVERLFLRYRLQNKKFSIIANNCWGGKIYQDLGYKYRSPFVGLFIYGPCYINLLEKLDHFLSCDLKFIPESKYEMAREDRAKNQYTYPIGLLGEEIEIHFLHCKSQEDACSQWGRRLQRLDMQNLYISFVDRYLFDDSYLERFERLPYRKILFTAKNYPGRKNARWLKEFNQDGRVGDVMQTFKKYFDVINWLNGGNGIPIFPIRILNSFFSWVDNWQ